MFYGKVQIEQKLSLYIIPNGECNTHIKYNYKAIYLSIFISTVFKKAECNKINYFFIDVEAFFLKSPLKKDCLVVIALEFIRGMSIFYR